MKVSEWAEKNRFLSPEASAEPGKWYNSRAPYQVEIMDAFCDPNVEKVVIKSSAQIGKTEILLNVIGYYIDQYPSPILVVYPTIEMAKTWAKDRLSTLIRDTPCLQKKVFKSRAKTSENTILHKVFKGGHITVVGANSPVGLAMRPARIVLMDDIDRFPVSAGAEGDPCYLAEKRATTFWNRKVAYVSTPTIVNLSRIEREYEASDKRKFYIPCIHCNSYQVLTIQQLRYDKEAPELAYYECLYCKQPIRDADKLKMLKQGQWRAEKPTTNIAGFWINELYSPWVSFGYIATKYENAKKNEETMRVFTNTVLGEVWESDSTEAIEENTLNTRVEDYTFPEGAVVLTAGVDIQEERIEVLVVGWGIDEESWHIEHKILIGHVLDPHTWQQLSSFLDKTYTHPSGAVLKIACTCIDSGYMPKKVYDFVKKNHTRRIYAIKGSNQPGAPLLSRPKLAGKERVRLFQIGVSTIKDIIFARLKLQKFGSGYMHFNKQCDNEYFRQLTAEKAVLKYVKGYPYREYMKVRPRNEILDLWVYNIAAYNLLNPDVGKLKQMILNEKPQKSNEIKQNKTKIKSSKPFIRRQKGWVKGWM